jgi:uncharacterized Zn-finger protein
MKNKKYPQCQNDLKNTTMSERFKKYHNVRTISKISTMSERFQKYHNVRTISKIPQCQNNFKIQRKFVETEFVYIYMLKHIKVAWNLIKPAE